MTIVKTLAGDIRFFENGLIKQVVSESVTAELNHKRGGISIIDVQGKAIDIIALNIESIQVLPAADVPFSGDAEALWFALFPFIMKELHIDNATGGGAVIETNIKQIVSPTYLALLTDYILWVEIDCVLTLPPISAASVGRVYRIFARDVEIDLTPDAADLINGETLIKMKKYDMVTLRAGDANNWGIGD